MLKIQEIRELIKLVDQSNLDEFVYEFGDSKIKMKKNHAGSVTVVQPSNPTTADKQSLLEVETAALKAEVKPEPWQMDQEKDAIVHTENLHKITSPMVGTIYRAPSPDAESYVKIGSKVTEDSIVCIVEAMKLFNEIEAEIKGEIVEILVEDGQLVEYGQPLFLVKPE
jgi:acetyl-CoA carboxylase biotin carboxyl carrier protein